MLSLYNSLTNQKEIFKPIKPKEVRLYVCGMTVYDFCHLGHARVMVVFDVINRWLKLSGYSVQYVRNITDIDDKIIAKAAEENITIKELTEKFIIEMNKDADALGVLRPDSEPKATNHIGDIINMIQTLIDKGFAYVGDNKDVYYSVSDFKGYGKLSGKTLKDLRAGNRVDIDLNKKNNFDYEIENTSRSVGTKLSHYVYKTYGNNKLSDDTINIKLTGSAGQSLGAFLTKGIKLIVEGDCNDYVGKGLSGGIITAYPSPKNNLISNKNTIIGNTVLYGATAGKLFASGQAGERFAVRNSGSLSVVEGCGAHGCEYMTGGTAIILGEVGDNFGAGMTGGMAFVYDEKDEFKNFANPASIIWQQIETDFWKVFLKEKLNEFLKETNSVIAKKILDNFKNELKNFNQICPIEMLDKLDNPITLKPTIKKVS